MALGCTYNRLGKYKEAEAMHREARESREKVLGPEHPDTLVSVNDLALSLTCQGNTEKLRCYIDEYLK